MECGRKFAEEKDVAYLSCNLMRKDRGYVIYHR
jgi:hypothetical protein